MAITARELAALEGLGLRLAAGAHCADRAIGWAHAIELADPTPYLSGGELVMTTGINIGADAAAQSAYVQRLVAAGTAALAVDIGTTLDDIPAAVLAAGDNLGLPVLEVPASTPFIAITRAVVDAVKADELRSVQRVVDQQEVLARSTLRGGIPGVVSALADALSATVLVVGIDGEPLAGSGPRQQRLLDVLAESGRAGARQAGRVIPDGDAFVTVQALRAAQPVRGHLAVRTEAPMSGSDRLLVAHAVSLISIAVEKPARVVDAEDRLRTAVTGQLLGGAGIVDDGLLRYFGFDPAADVVVVVLTGVGPVLTAQQRIGQLLESSPYLMASAADEVVVVVPALGVGSRLHSVVDDLNDQLQVQAAGGAGRPVRLADLAVGAEQARMAARAGGGTGFTEFGELGPLPMLLGGRTAAELRIFAEPLDPLLADGDDLVTTLAAFLRCNGQMESAAADLRIHRHTMRNRMRRIAALLDDDLESAYKRAELLLAVTAHRLLVERGR